MFVVFFVFIKILKKTKFSKILLRAFSTELKVPLAIFKNFSKSL